MSENIIMPKLGMTMKEGTVEEWFKSEGDTVKQGESIVTISSEKLTNDVEAPASGTLLEIKVQAGEDAEVKAVLGVIGEEGEAIDKDEDDLASEKVKEDNEHEKETQEVKDTSQQSYDNKDNSPKSASRERIFISPLARNMAEDKGLDINKIKGTGGNHRITKLDIQRVEANGYDYASDTTSNEDTSHVPTHTVDTSAIGEGLNPMRQRIAQNMRQSLNNTAQLTLHRKVDADRLLDFKDRLATELKQADRPPKEIAKLEDRLRSRFEWGLIVDITPPDYETRMAILQKKIEEENLDIPPEALNYIANQIQSNIRELEGALTRLLAYSKLQGKPITTELTAEALKDIIQSPKSKKITIQDIQKVVGQYYSVRIEDFSAKKRTKSIAYPRQIAMYLSRELTDFSLPKIGEEFGGRDQLVSENGEGFTPEEAQYAMNHLDR